MKKKFCLLALFFALSFVIACKSESTKSVESASQPVAQATLQPTPEPTTTPELVTPAPGNFKKTFVGTIGEGASAIPIWMDIERNGASVSGNYFYDKPGAYNVAEKILDLKGKVDKDGNVTITETDYDNETSKEQQTGTFKGKVDGLTAGNVQTLRLIGTWSGAKEKKPLAVNLKELRFDLGGLSLNEKVLKEGKGKQRIQVVSHLPQISLQNITPAPPATPDPIVTAKIEKFNKTVSAFVINRTREFKKNAQEMIQEEAETAKTAANPSAETKSTEAKPEESKPAETKPAAPIPVASEERAYSMEVNYTITAANKDFISILFNFFEDTGGAHPNTTTASFNYDFNRNEALKLADLFMPKSNYLKTISDYCIKELKKLKTTDWVEEGAGAKLENFDSWNITNSGLRFTFDRYQVAAYVVGDHEVVMPFQALKPIVKPDGVIGPFVK